MILFQQYIDVQNHYNTSCIYIKLMIDVNKAIIYLNILHMHGMIMTLSIMYMMTSEYGFIEKLISLCGKN
jgi:hypothetical protein